MITDEQIDELVKWARRDALTCYNGDLVGQLADALDALKVERERCALDWTTPIQAIGADAVTRCPDAAASLESPNCAKRSSASMHVAEGSTHQTLTHGSARMRHVVLADARRDLGRSPVTAAQTPSAAPPLYDNALR